jgi:hypothetical protein
MIQYFLQIVGIYFNNVPNFSCNTEEIVEYGIYFSFSNLGYTLPSANTFTVTVINIAVFFQSLEYTQTYIYSYTVPTYILTYMHIVYINIT